MRKIFSIYKVQPCAQDGHCQYRAILNQLGNRSKNNLTVHELRRRVHNHIRTHSERFRPFVSDVSMETYLKGVAGSGWGDELTLSVIATLLNLRIAVFIVRPRMRTLVYEVGEKGKKRVRLLLDQEMQHYSGLVPK